MSISWQWAKANPDAAARKIRELELENAALRAYADKLADGLPCLPKDVENLREANLELAQENAALRHDNNALRAAIAESEEFARKEGEVARKFGQENAALRAALSRIDTVWMNQEEAYADYCEAAWRMVEIARAAINAARKQQP